MLTLIDFIFLFTMLLYAFCISAHNVSSLLAEFCTFVFLIHFPAGPGGQNSAFAFTFIVSSNVSGIFNVDAVTDPVNCFFFSEDSTGLGWVGLVGRGSVWNYIHDLLPFTKMLSLDLIEDFLIFKLI